MTTDWFVPDTETPASTSRPALPFLCVHHETESDRLTRELARKTTVRPGAHTAPTQGGDEGGEEEAGL